MKKNGKRKRSTTSVRQRIQCFKEALHLLNPNWKLTHSGTFKYVGKEEDK